MQRFKQMVYVILWHIGYIYRVTSQQQEFRIPVLTNASVKVWTCCMLKN